MSKHARQRRKSKGGALVLKKTDESLRQRVRELGGDKVGVVPIDVAKQRICAMVSDFYGNVLVAPEEFPITSAGLGLLDRRISEAKSKHELKWMVIGLERTGRLHEPVERVLGRQWEVKLIHPLVTSQLRKGFSRNIKTDGIDLDALIRAVVGCYGSTIKKLPMAYEGWRAIRRVRDELVHERSALKHRMHERIHAALPGFATKFDNLWTSRVAMALMKEMDSPAVLLKHSISGLRQWLRERGTSCSCRRADELLSWAADAAPPTAIACTETAILRADIKQLAFLTHRIEQYEIQLIEFLVETPFILLMSASGISHTLASGLGAEAGPMVFYATARNLSGRAGLYPRRHQSDDTDYQSGNMAKGAPHLRDVMMKCGRSLTMPKAAFFAWAESRRTLGWCEKEIVAAMANRFCRITHTMILSEQAFRHPDAKPGVSVIGKLLNVSADLGIEASKVTALALKAVARIPSYARAAEICNLENGDWKKDNRPREHGCSACTTRQITRETVPAVLEWFSQTEKQHDVTAINHFRSP